MYERVRQIDASAEELARALVTRLAGGLTRFDTARPGHLIVDVAARLFSLLFLALPHFATTLVTSAVVEVNGTRLSC